MGVLALAREMECHSCPGLKIYKMRTVVKSLHKRVLFVSQCNSSQIVSLQVQFKYDFLRL